eukprot:7385407-Prymnesium_polylepis.1
MDITCMGMRAAWRWYGDPHFNATLCKRYECARHTRSRRCRAGPRPYLQVSSVRCRRARPPHMGKRSDTAKAQTDPCQEQIRGRRMASRMSLARPGSRLPEAANSAKEPNRSAKLARGSVSLFGRV